MMPCITPKVIARLPAVSVESLAIVAPRIDISMNMAQLVAIDKRRAVWAHWVMTTQRSGA